MMGSTHGCEEVNLDRRALSSLKIFVVNHYWHLSRDVSVHQNVLANHSLRESERILQFTLLHSLMHKCYRPRYNEVMIAEV